jgi:hypothetical protein
MLRSWINYEPHGQTLTADYSNGWPAAGVGLQ